MIDAGEWPLKAIPFFVCLFRAHPVNAVISGDGWLCRRPKQSAIHFFGQTVLAGISARLWRNAGT